MGPARRAMMAGGGGFEPPLPGPEPGVLPLDDPPPSPRPLSHHTRRARPSQRMGGQRTRVLSARLGRKRGTLVDGILMVSPVRGSRTARAARRATTKVPKPLIVTRRPLRSESKIPPRNAAIAFSAEVLGLPAVLAMIATSSAFVTPPVYADGAEPVNGP